jgi:hypothetical protein
VVEIRRRPHRLASVGDLWPPRAIATAICLCLAALGVFLVWWLADVSSLDAWTPNIVVGLVVLAATITFVEWIVQREHQERVRPRLERALDELGQALFSFAFHTYSDYVMTHLKPVDPAEMNIPNDPVELCNFWVEGQDQIDSPRPTKDGQSLFLQECLEFVRRAQRVVDSNREHLPPELVVAIDRLDPIFSGHWLSDLVAEIKLRDARGLDSWLLIVLVQGTGRVGEALRAVDSERVRPLFAAPDAPPGPTAS